MKYRLLGRSGLRVSELCLGTMTFGEDWGWGADKPTSRALYDAYRAAGGNFFDTANRYTEGTSERYLGEFCASERDQVVLATKFTLWTRRDDPNACGNHRKNMVQALEASLKRLGTDRVDVFMLHSPPADVLTDAALFDKLSRLKDAGKIRCLGVSVESMVDVPLAARLPGVAALQLPIGRPERQALAPLLPELTARGIAVVGREVFAGSDGAPSRASLLREAVALPGLAVALVGMSSRRHLEANLATLA